MPPLRDCEIRNGKLYVGGWAYDPDEPSKSIPVHVYADDTFLGSVPTNAERPDVNSAKGITGIHGFNAYLDITPGNHTIYIYAINSAGGSDKNICIGTFNVTVSLTPSIVMLTSKPAGPVMLIVTFSPKFTG